MESVTDHHGSDRRTRTADHHASAQHDVQYLVCERCTERGRGRGARRRWLTCGHPAETHPDD